VKSGGNLREKEGEGGNPGRGAREKPYNGKSKETCLVPRGGTGKENLHFNNVLRKAVAVSSTNCLKPIRGYLGSSRQGQTNQEKKTVTDPPKAEKP